MGEHSSEPPSRGRCLRLVSWKNNLAIQVQKNKKHKAKSCHARRRDWGSESEIRPSNGSMYSRWSQLQTISLIDLIRWPSDQKSKVRTRAAPKRICRIGRERKGKVGNPHGDLVAPLAISNRLALATFFYSSCSMQWTFNQPELIGSSTSPRQIKKSPPLLSSS